MSLEKLGVRLDPRAGSEIVKKTRGPRKTEEREKLNGREAGLEEGKVAFPRGQRSLVPLLSLDPVMSQGVVSLPDLVGRSSIKSRDGKGLGSSLNPPRPQSFISERAAA